QQFTTGAGDDINPAIARDGTIAFSLRAFDSDIWRLPVNPATGSMTGAPQPVSKTTRVESRGAWSPDGKLMAFNSDRRGEMNIWIRKLESGVERQLTTGTGGDYQANWSPNQATVAFFSARAGNSDIWTADVATGKLTQLTQDRAMDTNPFYSPDGKQIAFMSDRLGRLEAWVMSADGSNQRSVSDLRAGGHFIRWTDDGEYFLFRAESGTQVQTMKVRVGDGIAERLRDVASGAHMSWSPKRDLIMDVRGHRTLLAYPLAGEPVKVFEFPESQVRIDYPVWSPDGMWLLFDRAAPRGGDIWLLKGAPKQ
nr:TolB family protein [Gemmatimonadaceae bacterium]